jgi:hypothetical protein
VVSCDNLVVAANSGHLDQVLFRHVPRPEQPTWGDFRAGALPRPLPQPLPHHQFEDAQRTLAQRNGQVSQRAPRPRTKPSPARSRARRAAPPSVPAVGLPASIRIPLGTTEGTTTETPSLDQPDAESAVRALPHGRLNVAESEPHSRSSGEVREGQTRPYPRHVATVTPPAAQGPERR